jgi:myo-inositol-1-phosphate synthase
MTFQNALCKHVVLLEIKVYKTKSTEIAGNNDFFFLFNPYVFSYMYYA